MRRFTLCTSVAMVALIGAVGFAQAPTKIATLADHVAVMKSNGQANGALNKSLGSGSFADAKTAAGTFRTNFTTLRAFWTEKKNADALKIVNDGLSRLDGLDKLLAAAPDQAAAQAAAKEFAGTTCAACHKTMREGDNQSGYRFRPEVDPFKF
jgi:mono/diheme cytochrome c family protein